MKIQNNNGCRSCGHAHWWSLDSMELKNCANPKCKCQAKDYTPIDNLEYFEYLYEKRS